MNRRTLFIGSAIALVAIFAAAAFAYTRWERSQADARARANAASLVRMHSPTLGPASAPVVIVEFLDPACETCRAFYPEVKKLMAEHPGRIRLVVRYAPFHQGSDKVVAVMEAARRQDRFWPVLEALLARQEDWTQHHVAHVERVWKHLEGKGLDLERLAFDLTSPDIRQVIAQDLDDARTLKVTKTPEFFVNGRPLPTFGLEPLRELVGEELARSR